GPAERDRWAPARPERSGLIEERLGALGEMVSGVAHELNNPLTAILGYAQILPSLEGFDRDQALTTIEQEALRASRIVRNLLAFARQHRASLEPVDIEAILRRVIDVRQYSLQADRVTIETRFAGVRSVMADEYQLEQVFLNLLNNAHQAMQIDGGTVTVATEQLASSVRVYISDTGPGVPDEVADRIFEPFFTTREVGTGVGLGLAIVYGIVAEHGGHVWAQPAATGGAEFVVELPAPAPVRAGAVDGVAGEGTAIAGAAMGRVLVVDDELPIRALTNEILSGLGYDVATAASANDAFRLLESGSFDALIVDMGLPRMDAAAFQRRVSERWPRLRSRLLWITDEPESDRAAALMGDGAHLEKPFGTQELLGALRALLATPS
ncbi:MAG: ATP-binding protein, partial [Dehalococcoidia bacterium]